MLTTVNTERQREGDDFGMYSGGLAEVKVVRVNEKKYMFMIGNHRLFDIVDGVIQHKEHSKGNTVLINPGILLEKLDNFLNGENDTG